MNVEILMIHFKRLFECLITINTRLKNKFVNQCDEFQSFLRFSFGDFLLLDDGVALQVAHKNNNKKTNLGPLSQLSSNGS